jgi:hypothetical protein
MTATHRWCGSLVDRPVPLHSCAGPIRRSPLPVDGCNPLQDATGAGDTNSSTPELYSVL